MEVLSRSRHVTENLSVFNKAVGTHFVDEVVLYALFSFPGRSVRISTDSFPFSVILKNEWRFTCNSYIQGESRSFGVVTHHSEVWRLLNPSRINTSATSGLQLLGLGGLLPFLYYCFAKINPLCVYRLQTFYCFVFIMHNRQQVRGLHVTIQFSIWILQILNPLCKYYIHCRYYTTISSTKRVLRVKK